MSNLSAGDHLLLSFQILLLGAFGWFSYAAYKTLKPRDEHSLRSVAILVLGDIGRSPRMMYHAQSFAENGFTTDLIGYPGSRPIPSLERLPRVQLRYIPEPPKFIQSFPFLIAAPIKIVIQVVNILMCLFIWIEKPPEFILVQNPPSIPALAIVQLVGRIRGSKVIIDWHNLGYSILALKLGKKHLFVRIYKWFEATFGYQAYAHLFVTKAMRDELVKKWNLQGQKIVLHDRPPQHFHRSSIQEIHELFCKLEPTITSKKTLRDFVPVFSRPYSTLLTEATAISKNQFSNALRPDAGYDFEGASAYTKLRMPSLRLDRPAILVSSTSWTPDEDFQILLEALQLYESRAEDLAAGTQSHDRNVPISTGRLPKLLVIVTGKGPMKEKYMKEIEDLQETWNWVRCTSMWLEAQDYPTLLGAADLGVCLHSSSSGLDLPMKVVDMFGCGLPVCALNFPCLDELVKHDKNGLVFNDSNQLGTQLEELLLSFPDCQRLQTLRSSLESVSKRSSTPTNPYMLKYQLDGSRTEDGSWTWSTWEDNWNRIMRPLILRDVNL